MRSRLISAGVLVTVVFSFTSGALAAPIQGPATDLDRTLASENAGRKLVVAETINDWAFLRRASVDMIGRIPSDEEIKEYFAWSEDQRRIKLVEKLVESDRFTDRWTVFLADLLRIRSNVQGGQAFLAYVHRALKTRMPYDELCRKLISSNGKANQVPEVGYILGDDVDPMALAGATAQVFMGVRIACAQCHNHPFDVWTREQFYGFAAYFGKTRRMVAPVTETLYTTETDQNVILWPPDDPEFRGQKRTPVTPAFPFVKDEADRPSKPVARLAALRDTLHRKALADAAAAKDEALVDNLIAASDQKVKDRTEGVVPELIDVKKEVKAQTSRLRIYDDIYRPSELRRELAKQVTSPYNRYFSRLLVNRVWKELVGRGFVEPVDDFSEDNPPSHPKTLDYLADEFVASGFDFRTVVKLIATSDAYRRSQLVDTELAVRIESEEAFVAAPVRRMLSESLYDSIVQAGHVFQRKYTAGYNQRTITEMVRIAVADENAQIERDALAELAAKTAAPAMKAMPAQPGDSGYNLEQAIELDFDSVLAAADKDAPNIEKMQAMSAEELEAMMMQKEAEARRAQPGMKYITKEVQRVIDHNPAFASAMRMASPANPSHFLRVFGQPARNALGDHRVHEASMRQALMMLNGSLTHEASQVGNVERMYQLLVGEERDTSQAVRLAYREILTREPSSAELAEAKELIQAAKDPLEGMADLRWVLLNGHEFRFLP